MSPLDDIPISDGPELETLDSEECGRHLAAGGVGRIALRGELAPEIRPVNFTVVGPDVVIRTGDGAIMDAAQRGECAGFEIDDIDRLEHTGWSVVVVGKLFEVPTLDSLLELPLRPWASGQKDRFVGLSLDRVSGIRIPAGRGNR
jgi:nitroimidazol reductase NimA-like FMN-containing flavoprotein (pyridoxamine 5'-phosphate oxidase superfamily)